MPEWRLMGNSPGLIEAEGRQMLRALIIGAVWAAAVAAAVAAITLASDWWIVSAVLAALAGLGTWDLLQKGHSILRAYPVLGHARWIAERIRPEIYQYFIESNTDGAPFDRETRDAVYRRAKGIKGDEPFGTERNVDEVGYEFLRHSLRAKHASDLARGLDSVARTAPSPTTSPCSTSLP